MGRTLVDHTYKDSRVYSLVVYNDSTRHIPSVLVVHFGKLDPDPTLTEDQRR